MLARPLLSRDAFRDRCLARDGHRCALCGGEAPLSVHHIVERKLFVEEGEKGGYFLDNGATLCDGCHLDAERTVLSCEAIRAACGIERVVLPAGFDPEAIYDKWGFRMLEEGLRIGSPLEKDEGCQRALRSADLHWTIL